jgi:DNA-binding response OmpR family regulator
LTKTIAANGNLLIDAQKLTNLIELIEAADSHIQAATEVSDRKKVLVAIEGARAALTQLSRVIRPNSIELRLDQERQVVLIDSAPVHLTAVEFRLLSLLLAYGGRPAVRSELCLALSGTNDLAAQRTLGVHVSNVRRKLRRVTGRGDLIQFKNGIGWFVQDSLGDGQKDLRAVRWAQIARL